MTERETYEELGWCPHCGQSKWHQLKSQPDQGMDLDEIADALSYITLKESVGEPLTDAERRILAFTLNASHTMENQYSVLFPQPEERDV